MRTVCLALVVMLSVSLMPCAAQNVGGPTPSASTDKHSTITTGGSFQSLLPFNQFRKGCFVQNPVSASEDLFVYFGPIASATTAAAVDLPPGAWVNCLAPNSIVLEDQVSVEAATTGHAFKAYSQP